MARALPPPGDPNTLYVLDLSGYVFRAYHGLPVLSNSKGEPTHATRGFAQMLNRLVRDVKPVYLAVAMDSASDDGWRKEKYPQYKATRPPPPPDLAQQMTRCRELVEAFAIPVLHAEGYEADDLIAACVREARAHELKTVVASADKDLMQLVRDDVLMWDAMRDRVYGPDEVREKWGVGPEQVRDLLALMGDTSDNVPGVGGVGEKTAAKLLNEYGSLDGVYKNLAALKGKLHENLKNDEANARLSYELVGLSDHIPVRLDLEALKYGGWDLAKVRALLVELEFNKLLDTLEATARAHTMAAKAAEKTQSTKGKGAAGDEPSGPRVYEPVLTLEKLDEAVEACRAARVFAVDTETTSIESWKAELVGVSLAYKPRHGVYIPIGHRVLGDPPQLPREKVLERLRPLFADGALRKVGHNVKYDDTVLRRAGAPVDGFDFDTMIASYLLDPERHSHKLDDLSRSELSYEMVSYDEVTKKTRGKQLSFDEVEIAAATRYAAEDADVALELAQRLRPRIDDEDALAALMRDVELPLALVLSRMEEHGVYLDVAQLTSLGAEVQVEIDRLEKELHAIAGKEFNVNAPRQLEAILFDEIGLPVRKRTKSGRSTDAEVLEELVESTGHPLPAKVLEYRSLAKLKGTYLDALPALVDKKSGRIHTQYNQAVAATGRLSSINPNLQNIPIRSELGRRIRRAFIAPPGTVLMAADYSQIELRVLAHLSKDAILVDAFTRDEDVHTRTAMEIFKVSKEQVTRAMRDKAKTTNFAVIYGQGDAALARRLDIPRDEAAKFIADYFRTFPGLTRFLDEVVSQARAGEGVRTVLGRRRFLPALASENRGLRAQAERIAKNTPIQGTAADIMKVAMVRVHRALTEKKLATKMVLTVHDELVFEVPLDERAVVELLVRSIMESVMPMAVPLKVSVGFGANWGEAH